MTPMVANGLDFMRPFTFGPRAAWILDVGVLAGGIAVLVASLLWRAFVLGRVQRREQALLDATASKPLIEGTGGVVFGRAVDETGNVCVEVEIWQEVRERLVSSESRFHEWAERERRVRVRPFFLLRDDGQQVYVEADEDAFVVGALETSYPIDKPLWRTRVAGVRGGEKVYAYGDLFRGPQPRAHGGYRDGTGWVLRPPRAGRMLLATEALRERYEKRIKFLRRWAIVLSIGFCGAHPFLSGPFLAAELFGVHTNGKVVYLEYHGGRHTGGSSGDCVLKARAEDGLLIVDSVPQETYEALKPALDRGEEVTIPLLRTGSFQVASYLGNQAYVSGFWLVAWVALAVGAVLGITFLYKSRFAWYDKEKLTEYGGSGSWKEMRPAAPILPHRDLSEGERPDVSTPAQREPV